MIVIVLPDIPDEDRLLRRAREGDKQAIRDIYEQYFPPVFNFIRLRVDSVMVAEDLASDVFIRLLEAIRGKTAPGHSLRGWLFKVARNVLYEHYGKTQRFTESALSEWQPAPDEHLEMSFIRTVTVQAARDALQKLSFDQQEVIILRFGQMLSLRETADIMGRKPNAIKALQFRAIQALRQILGEMRIDYGG